MGLGRACALALARSGASIVLIDIDVEAGQATRDELAASGASALFAHADVNSMADIDEAVAAAVTRFGGIDILVNNAARAIGGKVDEIDEARWNTVISTNLSSVWRG